MADDSGSGPDPSPLLAADEAESSSPETISEVLGEIANEPLWATSSNGDDGENGENLHPRHRTTPARWFVLLSFSLLAMFQNMTFNTYSPIYPVISKAFPSWSPSFLDWTVNTANVTYMLLIYPASLLYERWDVRRITLFSATTVFAGAAVRCVPIPDGPLHRGITISSMVLNGAGAWLGFGGPVVAERWFLPSERTFATALSAIVAPFAGTALGFVLGPLFAGDDHTALDERTARMRVDRLFWVEAALCLAALICCAAYFPDRPEQPPSEAAAAASSAERKRQKVRREETASLSNSSDGDDEEEAERVELEEEGEGRPLYNCDVAEEGVPPGVKVYFGCNGSAGRMPPAGAITKYWALCLGVAFPNGISQGWGSVLYSILAPLGATEGQAATLGFASTSAGCVGALAVSAALGRCTGRLKTSAVSCMAVAALSFFLFSAVASGCFSPFLSGEVAAGLAFATCVVSGAAFSASVPLYYELIFENSFGWADAGAGVMMSSLLTVVVQIVFTAVLALRGPGNSTLWTSWVAAASAALGSVALLGVRVEYRRLSVDQGTALLSTGCRFDREFGCF